MTDIHSRLYNSFCDLEQTEHEIIHIAADPQRISTQNVVVYDPNNAHYRPKTDLNDRHVVYDNIQLQAKQK